MPEERLEFALDDCLARLNAGTRIEDCLAAYPGLRLELEPLLMAAARVGAVAPPHMAADARSRGHARVTAAMHAEASGAERLEAGNWSWSRLLLVPAVAGAIALALFLGLGTSQAPDLAEASTVLTVLQGDVKVETSVGVVVARSGMQLRPGDRVITSPGARAVLTFFDGSTITLDPDTALKLRSVVESKGQVRASLDQSRGDTWTYVPPNLGPARIEIDTPTAKVKANSTGGTRTSVAAPGASATPAPAPAQPRELDVRVTGPALAFLTDPAGATVGVVAPGLAVNQIVRAEVIRTGESLVLRVPEPREGSFKLVLHALAAGSLSVAASAGNASAGDSATLQVAADEDWGLALSLQGDRVQLGRPVRLEPAAAFPPNVAIPDRVLERAKATIAAGSPQPTGTATKPPATATPSPTTTSTPRVTATPAGAATSALSPNP